MAFDSSTDYANYPTLAPLSEGTLSESPYLSCPVCGGTGFWLRRLDRVPVCMDCKYAIESEDAPEEAAQEVNELQQIFESMIQQMDAAQDQVADLSSTPKTTAAHASKFQIVRGKDHTVLLRPDGTVKAVGNNKFQQCNVQDWKNITAIATNSLYTVGLCDNGTLKFTQAGSSIFFNKLSDWKNITAIAASDSFLVARCADGTVKSRGITLPVWSGVTAIAAASGGVAVLCEDGSVRVVTTNNHGRKKTQDWSRIKAIAMGSQHIVGLCEDGTVKAVGYNKKSKLERIPRCEVSNWTHITAISAGQYHTVGLHENGRVLAVGSNANGQCNVSDWDHVVAICANETFTAGLRADGTVLCTDPTVHKLLEDIYT